MPYCNTILWIHPINIALTQSNQNRIHCIFAYPLSSNGLNSQSQLPRVILYTNSWYCNIVLTIHQCYLFWQKNYSTVIALIIITVKWKTISKKMFRLSFGGSNDENSAQIPKGKKANIYLLLLYSKMFSWTDCMKSFS